MEDNEKTYIHHSSMIEIYIIMSPKITFIVSFNENGT